MPIDQNQPTQFSNQDTTEGLTENARALWKPVQKKLSEVPMPSKRTQLIIASGVALGAVGVIAYIAARRKPRLGLLAGLAGPAMVAWNAYQKAAQTAKEEIKARLH